MVDLAQLLVASLEPATRKQAEQSLASLSLQQGFLMHLLLFVLSGTGAHGARLAGSVYFKNAVRRRWSDDAEEQPILEADKQALRPQIVAAMISLSNASDKALRAQIAESVAVIAKCDFPTHWPNLIDELVASLSATDYNVNIGVLETAHSIFARWRSQMRSNDLFSEIKFVLERFAEPFLQIFRQTATLLLSGSARNLALVAQSQLTLLKIFYDLTCHDLPPELEDTHAEFFGPEQGWFIRFLAWHPPELAAEADDSTPSLPSQIQTTVLEIAELYANLFTAELKGNGVIQAFVQSVWELVGSGQRSNVSDDQLVSQGLRFLATIVRSGNFTDIFAAQDVVAGLMQHVIIPNVYLRDHETEQFEDDPLEYIRRDLAPAGDAGTRRAAAADVLRALVGAGHDAQVTEIAGAWISARLSLYSSDPAGKWKDKDAAIAVLTAVAARGTTVVHGATSTSVLIDVVQFFAQNIVGDLQTPVHPILQVDAIRFLHTFRQQLTKAQLLQVLPLLVHHLRSEQYVCVSYAAIAIERILFMKAPGSLVDPLFAPEDVQASAPAILDALLTRIEAGGSPEKVAENDYLMKCVLRVLVTTREAFAAAFEGLLVRLVRVVTIISKNPSNPLFSQYTFESVAALIRFAIVARPDALAAFEAALFPPFTVILQEDIDQFVPYVFQLISQMLEAHTSVAPAAYRALLPLLLQPAVWAQRGSVPPLVRLLRAFLTRDAAAMLAAGQLEAALAVMQQRLIPSKLNEEYGFELLQAVVLAVPLEALSKYLPGVLISLLTRLQTSKTDSYVYHLTYFLFFTLAVQKPGLTPDFLIDAFEAIQPGLWGNLLSPIVVPQVPDMVFRDRKVVIVGLTRLLTQSERMLLEPLASIWPAAFTALLRLALRPAVGSAGTGAGDATVALTSIDVEEQAAGYQAAFARLAASEAPREDPAAGVPDEGAFLRGEFARLMLARAEVPALVTRAPDAALVEPFVRQLGA